MSKEFLRATLAEYFRANFSAAEVEYENQSTIDVSIRTTPFVKLALRLISNEQISLGTTPRTRQRGSVQVDIYVKHGSGSKQAYAIADTVDNLFSRQSILGIEFQTASTLPPLDVVGWYRLTIRCPFFFDS